MRTEAVKIVRKLTEAGHVAFFAGGCVRDMLRGQKPKDYDIATDARPSEVTALFPSSGEVGAHFGVVLVKAGGHHFEIATFRSDGDYRDGRRPESVTYTTPEEDAKRRDFTVNGMFFDPLKEEVIDFVGGRADLEAGVLRAIGDAEKRFQEDYLRMLRAVRFATVLGFEIEEKTWEALRNNAPNILKISPERIRDELNRVWLSENRQRGFDLLVDSGLMTQVLPEIMALQGCEQPPQFHPEGDVFVHTRLMLGLLPAEVSLPLVLSVLFHDIGKPATATVDEDGRIRFNTHDKVGARMTEDILRRLRYSNEIIEATVEAVEIHMVFKDVRKMRTSKLKRFMARPYFEDEMELHRVDCESSHGSLANYEFLRDKEEEFSNEPLIPPRLLSGNDLIALGWPSGPEIGEVLSQVEDLHLEGRLKNREEALAWVRGNTRPPAGAAAGN